MTDSIYPITVVSLMLTRNIGGNTYILLDNLTYKLPITLLQVNTLFEESAIQIADKLGIKLRNLRFLKIFNNIDAVTNNHNIEIGMFAELESGEPSNKELCWHRLNSLPTELPKSTGSSITAYCSGRVLYESNSDLLS